MRQKAFFLAVFFLFIPIVASANYSLSVKTQQDVFGLMLMDENGNSVSNVTEKSVNGDVIEWELDISYCDSEFVTLFAQDAAGNWLRTEKLYRMSELFPEGKESQWPKTIYSGTVTSVYPLEAEKRYQSFCGPAKSYHGAGAYKSYKIESVQALFIEKGYVYVDLSYTTVGTRRLYFQSKIFTNLSDIPEVSLASFPAQTTEILTPQFGPGYSYDSFKEAKIGAGTSISVFYEESGWAFAEFKCKELGLVRAWIPVEQVVPE